jgi:sugar phosphate isomerase/epimerase
MNHIKIASPLYIVREECSKDLFAVLEKLKRLGFEGIEFLGFFNQSPEKIRHKLDELNMIALGNHVDYHHFLNNMDETIHSHQILGCEYITITGLPKEQLQGEIFLQEYITNVTRIGAICRDRGITLLYHNHDHELSIQVKGHSLLEEIWDRIPQESISFEPDLGWMEIGGAEPAYFLDKYQDRCPVIHLKDYYAVDRLGIGNVHELNGMKGKESHSYFEFRPIGYGIANIPRLMSRIKNCNPKWVVADHDLAYDRDSYYDLELSLNYIRNILAIHNKDLS